MDLCSMVSECCVCLTGIFELNSTLLRWNTARYFQWCRARHKGCLISFVLPQTFLGGSFDPYKLAFWVLLLLFYGSCGLNAQSSSHVKLRWWKRATSCRLPGVSRGPPMDRGPHFEKCWWWQIISRLASYCKTQYQLCNSCTAFGGVWCVLLLTQCPLGGILVRSWQ